MRETQIGNRCRADSAKPLHVLSLVCLNGKYSVNSDVS